MLKRLTANRRLPDILTDLLVLAAALAAVLPFLIYGKNSVVSVHDFFDSNFAVIKMFKDQGLLFALDTPTRSMGGLSTLYYPAGSYDLMKILYALFEPFAALQIGYVLKVALGFVSMYLFLRLIFKDPAHRNVLKLVSIAFALLPCAPQWWLATATVPLLAWLFCRLAVLEKFTPKSLLLVFFPLVSRFVVTGVFVVCLWVVCGAVYCIWKKAVRWNLLAGLACLCVGYAVVDLPLFYMALVDHTPMHRAMTDGAGKNLTEALIYAVNNFLTDLNTYHAINLQTLIVLPAAVCCILFVMFRVYREILRSRSPLEDRPIVRPAVVASFALLAALLLDAVGGLYLWAPAKTLVAKVVPFLKGFNWGRAMFLNQAAFYVAFAGALLILLAFKHTRAVAYVLAVLQIVLILLTPNIYNFSYYGLRRDAAMQQENLVTVNQFYDDALFDEVKEAIGYHGEFVAAVGFHPAVLMYNGFNTLDGYSSIVPEDYYQSFRKVVEPYLEQDGARRLASRLYLYCDELSFQPTRKPARQAADLYIDTAAFREAGGAYLLSRAGIANAEALGLVSAGEYTEKDSIYTIHVYAVQSEDRG